ncbi:39S ribosomal protein L2, mitochondrial-like [Argiope bruennichi]|uniref:39S ribosomal protein L2 like protein n=1 Tax=Argiope bruennichi TaxID=94029 RepID=A0A8T0EA78_ARGBR|nr:39S ribosomal protein L2, mitochondrial-like [Argiope bruennichi]KAF8769936.1 39S ribosomal protein L2 like protein [Argiope bruennichi]
MSVLNILSLTLNLQKRLLTDTLKSTMVRVDCASVDSLVNHCVTAVRYAWRNERVFRKIRGGGRPVREGVVPPEKSKYGWRPVLPEDGQYTTRPLPIIKMGGRHPETGRVVVRTIGGGHKKQFRWVDYKREGPADGSVLEERVMQVRYDPCRTAWIALVASGDHKRWIIATDGVKVGDIIKTSSYIPRIPVRPVQGDAYAIGALPIGTVVHNIEVTPGGGALFCRAAGSSAQYIRKMDNKCLLQLPSKRQLLLDEKCMVVVGQVSNIEHGSIPIGSPNRLRAMGKRPRSGLWHRKDGYCGRKIRPPKSILDTLAEREKKPEFYNLTFKA